MSSNRKWYLSWEVEQQILLTQYGARYMLNVFPYPSHKENNNCVAKKLDSIGPLHDPVTWYGINCTQITQWDFQNKGTRTSPARLSFVLKVRLRNSRPSVIYSVPCDRIVQRAYCIFLPKARVSGYLFVKGKYDLTPLSHSCY